MILQTCKCYILCSSKLLSSYTQQVWKLPTGWLRIYIVVLGYFLENLFDQVSEYILEESQCPRVYSLFANSDNKDVASSHTATACFFDWRQHLIMSGSDVKEVKPQQCGRLFRLSIVHFSQLRIDTNSQLWF